MFPGREGYSSREMLRTTVVIVLLMSLAGFGQSRQTSSTGPVYVKGYTTKSGHYVEPHYRTRPNKNFYNNWSTKGNENPWNQRKGKQKQKSLLRRPSAKLFHKQRKETKQKAQSE